MWEPTLQDFQELFSNEHTLKILLSLYQKNNQKVTATEISDILSIHISTAKKYLDLLYNAGFIDKKVMKDKPGKPTIFNIKRTEYNVVLNLETLSSVEIEEINIKNLMIREKPNLHTRITYEIGKNGLIDQINIKLNTKAKKIITIKLILTLNEKFFLKFVPLPSEETKQLIKLCYNAKIYSKPDIKLIESFVYKLKKYDILEVIEDY